ncbi:RNA polymerase sigma factor [Thalassotalea ganghwensis]
MADTIELPFLHPRGFTDSVLEKGSRLSHKAIFYQWMTEYEKLLRHLIIGFEAKPALQDELFQEIALNIWRALPSFRQESSAKTFVARIAHNVLATHVAKSVKTIDTDETIDNQQLPEEQTLQSSCPYQALDQQQRQKRLINAIQTLPIEHQQVITLALEGMSYKEIAETLAITTNLVGVRLQRAKVALNEKLEKQS